MRDQAGPKISKWPFFLGDFLLVSLAGLIYFRSDVPLGFCQVGLIVFCVVAGACLAIVPFLLEYRVMAKLAEANALEDVVGQMRNLENIAQQIAGATARWQSV